jgi:hypothetical protein
VVGEYEDANGRRRYITSKTKTKAEMIEHRVVGLAIPLGVAVLEHEADDPLVHVRAAAPLASDVRMRRRG